MEVSSGGDRGIPLPQRTRTSWGLFRDWRDTTICTRLIIPSDVASLRVLRVTAAAAASDVIEDLDALDSLRLAVDELAVALIEAARADSSLELEVECTQDEVQVTGRAEGVGVSPELSEVGTTLVASGTTRYGLLAEGDTVAFRATFAPMRSSQS